MGRYVYHGVREPRRLSLAQRVRLALFPVRPIEIRAAHIPQPPSISNRRMPTLQVGPGSILMARRASISKRGSTVHVSAEPRHLLEKAVIGFGAFVVASSVVYWAFSRDVVFLTNRERTMAFSWEFEREYFGSRVDKNNDQRDADLGPRVEPENDPRSAMVHEIARRIILVAEQDFPEVRNKLEWKVVVRKNPTINAFCEPGGSLTVFTGLIDCMVNAQIEGRVESARDAVAAVVAHEISHG